MKSKVEVIMAGKVVKRSKSLRGILDYARISPVSKVYVYASQQIRDTYMVHFHFLNGAMSATAWVSWRVAIDWVKARRSWGKPRKHELESVFVFDYN